MARGQLASVLITTDTSGLFAAINRGAPDHERAREALRADRGPYVVPAAILAEMAYLIEQRGRPTMLDTFLTDLETGLYALDCGEHDFPRIRELVRRYADLPLGFVDAAVIACAERRGGRVLTLDLRHFGVVAREGRLVLLPE